MKKFLSFLVFLFAARLNVYGQASFNSMDSIDVNNITANMLVHGDMMWNPVDYSASGCQFPAHSGKFINFTTALWISGYDASGSLHIAAQTYRQNGNDFWPGPLNSADTLTYPTSYDWAKIWKVNSGDIEYFKSLSTHTVSNTPQAILTWPGNGSAQAQGNAGAALSVDHDMAPFIDLNGNGIYEPLLGDYPDIKGDQALWWAFSDNGPAHTETNGKPLGVEVHAMAYGYHRNTLIDNVVYLDYTIENKSGNDYSNVRAAWFDDVQIGWYYDDYIGFDSTRRMGYCYNGTNDDGAGGGHPVNSYGLNPPAAGITMIALPGDAGSSYIPVGSFGDFFNDASTSGNPSVDSEYNNYMHAKYRDGKHFFHDTVTTGPPYPPASGPDCIYMYPGDPINPAEWSECSSNSTPGDIRAVLASNDFSMPSGSSQHIVIAYVVADSFGGCGATHYNDLIRVADTAWADYHNPPPPNSVKSISSQAAINIYPNPAHDKLYIENTGNSTGDKSITIYNSIGQVVSVSITPSNTKDVIDLNTLPPGPYHVLYRYGDQQKSATFIKD